MAGKRNVFFNCKTLRCNKLHGSQYSAGQCTRHYGPNKVVKPALQKSDLEANTPIIDCNDYELPILSNYASDEESWPLFNDDLSDGASSHDASESTINDHYVEEASEVNGVIWIQAK